MFFSSLFLGGIDKAMLTLHSQIRDGQTLFSPMKLIGSKSTSVVMAFANLVACEIKYLRLTSGTRDMRIDTQRNILRALAEARAFFVDVSWDGFAGDYVIAPVQNSKRQRVVGGLLPYKPCNIYGS